MASYPPAVQGTVPEAKEYFSVLASNPCWQEKCLVPSAMTAVCIDPFVALGTCHGITGGSPPIFFMNIAHFDQIISFESLLKSHQRARIGKQHKREVIEFEANLSRNLWELHYQLKYHHYRIGGYRKFMIHDPKEREIQAISYRDRIVQHSLCDYLLVPLLENHLIDANCACRVGKGSRYAVKLLRSFMTQHYRKQGATGYFVKLDISKYFPSIDHQILYKKLRRYPFDKDTWWLLQVVIDSYGSGKGLPMGNQSSQCFALLYLDRIDRVIKEKLRVKYYVRYMDDMILLVSDKSSAQQCLECIGQEIKGENLVLNAKSQIIKTCNGVEFLGWHFKYSLSGKIVQKVKQQSKKRILAKCRYNYFLVSNGQKTVENYLISLSSYRGHLLQGHGWYLYRKIITSFSLTYGKKTQ